MADVEAAFLEREEQDKIKTDRYMQLAVDYANGKELPKYLIQWFGDIKPTKEQLDDYIKHAIAQAQGDEIIRKYYQVAVNLEFISDKFLALHKSLNPRVTFGYSSSLHEECDTELTDDLRNILLPCFKNRRDGDIYGRASYGEILLTDTESYIESYILQYEDIIIYRGNKEILSTVTHEFMLDTDFEESDFQALKVFEDKPKRNSRIIAKLKAEKLKQNS